MDENDLTLRAWEVKTQQVGTGLIETQHYLARNPFRLQQYAARSTGPQRIVLGARAMKAGELLPVQWDPAVFRDDLTIPDAVLDTGDGDKDVRVVVLPVWAALALTRGARRDGDPVLLKLFPQAMFGPQHGEN